ncbi:ribosome silencing factor [Parahaliea aestuarii]|uniref:Ribosomal silencing factor RsfS n=1 Tax=Parahaliea aestuarii TaxID=1852021 RepID=A0A5C9A6F7_9GAMM|nr:ribosome silencing factor [Parahaliea aestuarii]TXS95137.1 ribosome silencing factor [Parahaliea aestuarii]
MQAEQIKQIVETALDDLKAVNIVTLDVTGLTDVMDYLVIASGTSNRHVKSLANNVVVEGKKQGARPLGVEGEDAGDWVLVDFGDVVVHVMLPATRDFYDLERLWVRPVAGSASEQEAERD